MKKLSYVLASVILVVACIILVTFNVSNETIEANTEKIELANDQANLATPYETAESVKEDTKESEIEDVVKETKQQEVVPTTTPKPTATPEPKPSVAVSKASSYVKIRKENNQKSDVVGKLYQGAVADVISVEGDWVLIESGTVKGYASKAYLNLGTDLKKMAAKYATKTAKVNVTTLKVRSEQNTTSAVVTTIAKGTTHRVIKEYDEWVKIQIDGQKQSGYVSKQYVTIRTTYPKAISIKEEQAKLKAEQEAKEKAEAKRKAELAKKEADKKKQEEKKKEEDKKQQQSKPNSSSSNSKPSSTSNVSNTNLMAAIIYCEAGSESYQGKLAVASAIMNRVKSSRYPNSVKSVIYQSGQFGPVRSGSLQRQLNRIHSYKTKNELDCIKAAKAALAGSNNIGNRVSFRVGSSATVGKYKNGLLIGNHIFF